MKDTFWFKHDCSASRDPKILEMKSIYGFEGYGLFWAIIEALREQDGYKYKVSEKYGLKLLAGLIGYDPKAFEGFVNDLVNEFGLLEFQDGFLYSKSLLERMKQWDTAKANGRKGGRPKKGANSDTEKPKPKPELKPKPKPEKKPDPKPIREEKRREDNKDKALLSLGKENQIFLEDILEVFDQRKIWLENLQLKRPGVDLKKQVENFASYLIENDRESLDWRKLSAAFVRWTNSDLAKEQAGSESEQIERAKITDEVGEIWNRISISLGTEISGFELPWKRLAVDSATLRNEDADFYQSAWHFRRYMNEINIFEK